MASNSSTYYVYGLDLKWHTLSILALVDLLMHVLAGDHTH